MEKATGAYKKSPQCPGPDGLGKGGVPGTGSSSPASPTNSGSGCKELANVQCRLETKDLWDKFHELGTEMIITKTGR